jgi:hypothetical protein
MTYWSNVTDHGDILDIAGDWLTEAGLRLVVDTDNAHRYKVWNDAVAAYGPDIALIHAPADEGRLGTEFKVHWNFRHPEHALIVVDAFGKAGCAATWDGNSAGAVYIKVGGGER